MPKVRKTRTSARRRPSPLLAGLPEPPWARVRRVPLVRREIRESLSRSALDVLWTQAETVVEGSHELRGGNRADVRRFYAGVMVTIDLTRCRGFFREPADAATAQRVAELMLDCPGLRDKLAVLVRPELARLSGVAPARLILDQRRARDHALGTGGDVYRFSLDHHVRAEGVRILIDGDAVVSLESDRGAGTTPALGRHGGEA